MSKRTLVCIESPYKGKAVAQNKRYLARALRSSLLSHEAPFASHGLYTLPNCLKDSKPEERHLGIQAGLDFVECCDLTVVYFDYGVSVGMLQGIDAAREAGRPIVWRLIGKNDTPFEAWVQVPDSIVLESGVTVEELIEALSFNLKRVSGD